MRPLDDSDILTVWERSPHQSLLDRGLTLLAVGYPELSQEGLAMLDVADRDSRLLKLRELTFGSYLEGFTQCSKCSERIEFTFETSEISKSATLPPSNQQYELTTDGWHLRYRLPNSGDLALAEAPTELSASRRLLGQRCVIEARRDGTIQLTEDLPDEVIALLSAQMTEIAPPAEVLLDFQCPSCSHRWQSLFDIVSFFWTEVAARAKRVLWEVHALARAYGWREADILAMSARRRQLYLEMIGA